MTTKRKTNLAINLAVVLTICAKKCVACGFTTHFKKVTFMNIHSARLANFSFTREVVMRGGGERWLAHLDIELREVWA